MEFETMRADDLRRVARHFAPETRGVGGLAHTGSRQQLIDLLQQKGVMPCEAEEYLAGAKAIKAPEQPEQGAAVDPLAEVKKRKCWLCKGYGELKSYCDAPDRTCPACEGTGEDKPL
jgi:hypothetical protein